MRADAKSMTLVAYPRSVDSHLPARPAAFFDLDKTIIAKSSTLAFSRSFYQGGLINRRAVLRSAYAQFVYLAGGADHGVRLLARRKFPMRVRVVV